MRKLLALLALLVLPLHAQAAQRIDQYTYFPSFGIGSTSSVAYGVAAGTTFAMIASDGNANALVRVFTTTAAYIAVGASPTATASGMLIPANTERIIEIPSGYKVSAAPLSSSGVLYSTLLTMFPTD